MIEDTKDFPLSTQTNSKSKTTLSLLLLLVACYKSIVRIIVIMSPLRVFIILSNILVVSSFAPVSQLIQKNAALIDSLKTTVGESVIEEQCLNDVFFLRFCLVSDGDEGGAKEALGKAMSWRNGKGKAICESALKAINSATASDKWDNTAVQENAPHSSVINKFITSSQCITTSSNQGDLVYCIRAGKIDDVSLMSAVKQEQMVEFFLYCKEVNSIVANQRSLSSDKLVEVITANDLSGVDLFGDATFRKALSASSKEANDVYPALSGPTLLLNLPRLLGALVKLFKPLFPKEVQARLKFEQGPLKDVDDLTEILEGGKRDKFLSDLDELVYGV